MYTVNHIILRRGHLPGRGFRNSLFFVLNYLSEDGLLLSPSALSCLLLLFSYVLCVFITLYPSSFSVFRFIIFL